MLRLMIEESISRACVSFFAWRTSGEFGALAVLQLIFAADAAWYDVVCMQGERTSPPDDDHLLHQLT